MFLKNESKEFHKFLQGIWQSLLVKQQKKPTHFKNESEFGMHAPVFITQQANSFDRSRKFDNKKFSIALVKVTENFWSPLPQRPNPFSVLMCPKGSLMKMKIFLCPS